MSDDNKHVDEPVETEGEDQGSPKGSKEYDVSWLRKADKKTPAKASSTEAAGSATKPSTDPGAGAPLPPLPVPLEPSPLEPEILEPVDRDTIESVERALALPKPVPSLDTAEADRISQEESAAWQAKKAQREREAWEEAQRVREEQEREAQRARDEQEQNDTTDDTQAPASDTTDEAEPQEETKPDIDYLARARELSRRRNEESQEEVKRDFNRIVEEVQHHIRNDYDLIGLVGYSGSGKTHFLRALSMLLKQTQGFEVAEWSTLRKSSVPGVSAAEAFYYPVSRGKRDKWVFVDAGGELYARLSINDWQLAEDSAGLLHSLHHCKALCLLLNLQRGHFLLGSAGEHRWMNEKEKEDDADIQAAQEELEFFDSFLLFLRALISTGGKVDELVDQCAELGLDKALRPYRDKAPKLDIPVQVLFTQADTYDARKIEIAEAIPLSPKRTTVGVAPFVARHLPTLLSTMLDHATRFRFDFVQSYEEKSVQGDDGETHNIPKWDNARGLLSCGVLPALEFLIRNLPAKRFPGSLLQRFEIDTRKALKLDRLLRRKQWRDFEVSL